MSLSQSRAFVWDHQEESDNDFDSEDEFGEDERLYAFEVMKTNEQEETVVSRPGFTVSIQSSVPWARLIHLL